MKKIADRCLVGFAWLSAGMVTLAAVMLVGFLLRRGLASIDGSLFFGETHWLDAVSGRAPVFEGIWPALMGTLYLVLVSSFVSIPVGIASGVYLAEYASKRVRASLGCAVDLLAGTPSIVMGLFGFALILLLRRTLFPQAGTSLALAALCIALLVLPYVIRTTQTALQAIPVHLRILGPVCGLSGLQAIVHILLPVASRGILSGVILAMGRAAEDTAVILLTGVVAQAGMPRGLWERFEALPFRIYYLAAEHQTRRQLDQGFATSLVLLLLTSTLFLTAFMLQRRFEKRWKKW
ncbi:PstA family ABC transporter permease [Desulfoferrobacter suflitae]|uniref:PstA family ABC transporter permease n=1 Tax=Desulfoferrobacter suflitae TaxID=2865782 RepID=UPI002164CB2C|nr:ABC transporter permease subunit [Desulfoferrobacter suflitae]MCK8602583.1 ABC transporter permease subunit [Desulfoferrobacter suflitae]